MLTNCNSFVFYNLYIYPKSGPHAPCLQENKKSIFNVGIIIALPIKH